VLLSPVILAEPMRLTPAVIASIVALGVLGTGLAYVWNQNTLRTWGPTRASTVTYISPVVGVALGILILGERLTWNEPTGALIVFLGILLAQERVRLGRRARA
jgi:drug/metabolite transporter (DMT)-like permease